MTRKEPRMVQVRTRRRTYSGGRVEDYEIDIDNMVVEAMNACNSGNLQKVKTLQGLCGMIFTMTDYDLRSPLHQAVEHSHLLVVKHLVQNCGVPLNVPDRWNKCPVSLAREKGHSDIVEYLEEQALREDRAMLEQGTSHEAIAYKLCDAAAKGNLRFLKESHKQGINLAYEDYDGRTALHLACSEGHVKVIKFLLKVLPKHSVLIVDRFGHTPLIDAQKSGNLQIIALFKAHCSSAAKSVVSPASEAIRKVALWEALHAAFTQGSEAGLRAALQKLDSRQMLMEVLVSTGEQCDQWRKAGDQSGNSEPHSIVMLGSSGKLLEEVCYASSESYGMMAAILEKECQFGVLASDVMDALIRQKEDRVLQLFLEKTNADPNVTNEGGRRPLYTAIEVGNSGAVNLLLQHGADLNGVAQQYRYSPLLYLIRNENLTRASFMNMLEFLLTAGADPNAYESYHGLYPIHHVFQSSRTSDEIISIIKLLLKHKAKVDTEDRAGFTALHYASGDAHHRPTQKLNEYERKEIVRFLVESGSEINCSSNDGSTALHFAVKAGYHSVVRCLLECGADSHQKNASNYTAADFPLEGSEIRRLLNDHQSGPMVLVKPSVTFLSSSISSRISPLVGKPPERSLRKAGINRMTDTLHGTSKTDKTSPVKSYERTTINTQLFKDCPNTSALSTSTAFLKRAHTRQEKSALLKAAMQFLSQRIGEKYATFSRHLNADVDDLRANATLADVVWSCSHEGLEEVVYQVLYRWCQRVGHTASLTDLVRALANANMPLLKRAFQKEFASDLVRELISRNTTKK